MVPNPDDRRLPRIDPGISSEDRASMWCPDCGATFLRSEVAAPEKGTLVCPDCGSSEIEDVDGTAPDRSGS